jgi:hypothetical protein
LVYRVQHINNTIFSIVKYFIMFLKNTYISHEMSLIRLECYPGGNEYDLWIWLLKISPYFLFWLWDLNAYIYMDLDGG